MIRVGVVDDQDKAFGRGRDFLNGKTRAYLLALAGELIRDHTAGIERRA